VHTLTTHMRATTITVDGGVSRKRKSSPTRTSQGVDMHMHWRAFSYTMYMHWRTLCVLQRA